MQSQVRMSAPLLGSTEVGFGRKCARRIRSTAPIEGLVQAKELCLAKRKDLHRSLNVARFLLPGPYKVRVKYLRTADAFLCDFPSVESGRANEWHLI